MLRTSVGLALGAVAVLGAGAIFIGFVKVVQVGARGYDAVFGR